MNKVYTVIFEYNIGMVFSYFQGVFSTKEKAVNYIVKESLIMSGERPKKEKNNNEIFMFWDANNLVRAYISEQTIDVPNK